MSSKCRVAGERAARIGRARNQALDHLRTLSPWAQLELVLVADMDGRPSALRGVEHLARFVRAAPRHAAFPTFTYDNWALRPLEETLVCRAQPLSCFPCEIVPAITRSRPFSKLWARAMHATRAGDGRAIAVASAFNGVGLYSTAAIGKCRYDADGDCEHVSFHRCLRERNGATLALIPTAIAAGSRNDWDWDAGHDRTKRLYRLLGELKARSAPRAVQANAKIFAAGSGGGTMPRETECAAASGVARASHAASLYRARKVRASLSPRGSCVLLFFIHIPKTGASSVEGFLRRVLRARAHVLQDGRGVWNNLELNHQLAETLDALTQGRPLQTAAHSIHSSIEHQNELPSNEPPPLKLPPVSAVIDALLRARMNTSGTCRIRLATILRQPVAHAVSAFHYDRGTRHGKRFSSVRAYMRAASNCSSINHQLSFLVGRYDPPPPAPTHLPLPTRHAHTGMKTQKCVERSRSLQRVSTGHLAHLAASTTL